MRFAAVCAITLLLGIAASPVAADPDPRGSEIRPPEDRTTQIERLIALEEKDPAGFRDLLRRSLTARLLWAASGRPLPPDFPVELARP